MQYYTTTTLSLRLGVYAHKTRQLLDLWPSLPLASPTLAFVNTRPIPTSYTAASIQFYVADSDTTAGLVIHPHPVDGLVSTRVGARELWFPALKRKAARDDVGCLLDRERLVVVVMAG